MLSYSLSEKSAAVWFYAFAALTVAGFFVSLAVDESFPLLIPFAILFVYFALFDFKKVYFLLLFLIPLTREFDIPGGVSLDLPGEPVLIVLMFIFFFYLLKKRTYEIAFLKNPLIQLLALHLLWILITVLFSYKVLISTKFFLAKIWYITTYILLTGLFVKKIKDFKILFWSVLIPTCFTIIMVLLRHAATGFSFDDVNAATAIFYRNHVNYAAFVSLLMPFIWLAATWYGKATLPRHFLNLTKLLFIIAIYFAYARGAWLALIAAIGFYYAMKLRLFKFILPVMLVIFIFIAHHMVTDNKYLDYAPEFSKAIYHGSLTEHIQATIRNQDLSTAERFYRWVAGIHMAGEHPLTGFGPGSFYHFYQYYTVTAFTTYVSDNPEKSGVHNYFLMTTVEQGIPGLLIFLLLTFGIFYFGIRTYHRASDESEKNYIAAIICSMVIIYTQLLLSDLVEEIKIGGFFFINIALLANCMLLQQKREKPIELK